MVGWSWLYIFAILSSYYVMRPIRDQMGISGGIENLPWLFTGTLVGMVVLNVPFGYLVKRLPRITFIPLIYRFFSANILLFALALHLADPDQAVWIGRAFFIWLSVFNLFVVSIFWQTIVDVFTSEQGKRLFGFIAAGATLGAISGSAATAILARDVPTWALLVGAAILLEVAVFSVKRLSQLSDELNRAPAATRPGERPIGGSALAGITHALRSPYLLNVSLFLLLFSITSTFLYFEQVGVTAKAFPDRASQTAFFATVDLLVNILTLGDPALPDRSRGAAVRGRAGAGVAAAAEHLRVRRPGIRADGGRHRDVPGAAARRELRDRAPDPRGAVHGAPAGGPLQGEELHRHGGLPPRRPGRRGGHIRSSGSSARVRARCRSSRCRSRCSGS